MRIWREFARRYRGILNSKLSFNLINEPSGFSEQQFIDVFERTIDAIRAVDPGRFEPPLLHLARYEGLRRAPVTLAGKMPALEEMDAFAGVSADGRTVRAALGRFRDRLVFTNRLETTVPFRLPKDWAGRTVRVSVLTLDDRNNWYMDSFFLSSVRPPSLAPCGARLRRTPSFANSSFLHLACHP